MWNKTSVQLRFDVDWRTSVCGLAGSPEDDAGGAQRLRSLTRSSQAVSKLPVWCQREFTEQTGGDAHSRHGESCRILALQSRTRSRSNTIAADRRDLSGRKRSSDLSAFSFSSPARGDSWCATASWWMQATASAACVTSSSTPTSCCAPDSNTQAEGELHTWTRQLLCGETWSTRAAGSLIPVKRPRSPQERDDCEILKTSACVGSRKQDQYRFSWYLPLAGLRLRWVADHEQPPDTTVRLLNLRTKMFLLRQQLQQNPVRVMKTFFKIIIISLLFLKKCVFIKANS